MSRAISKDDLLAALRRHVGKHNGITGKNLVEEIIQASTDPVAERNLRQLVSELRMEGHHICAHPATGYFIARTESELDQTCEFLYERAMASLAQVSRMKNVSLPDLRGQLKLPT